LSASLPQACGSRSQYIGCRRGWEVVARQGLRRIARLRGERRTDYDGPVTIHLSVHFRHLQTVGKRMTSRREKIEAMLAADPQDQFLRYGLAVEYDNEERHDESLALFTGLMHDSPPHVPSFLRGAQLLSKVDRIDDARAVLRTGIEAARQQGNSHAAGEMGELLATLGTLGD